MAAVQAGDVILVHFLDPQPLGLTFLRHRNDWPLHMTLLPWFAVPDSQALEYELVRLCSQTKPAVITVGEETMFNPETKVSLIRNSTQLQQIHESLLELIKTLGGTCRAEQWTGAAYKPHVTHHDGQPVPKVGTNLVVKEVSLVRIDNANTCEVIQHISLGETRHETAA